MFVLKNVTVRYPGSQEDALTDVTTVFKEGEFVCILGKSGAGKSTFIRCLNGLQTYQSGSITWHGKELKEMNQEELRRTRRQMGMIFQHFHLIPRLTVFQNVLTGLFGFRPAYRNIFGFFSQEEKEKAYRVLESVDLKPLAGRRVESLSGGQKQRVAIARALLQNPRVFLGDEPVASLDPGTAERIFRLILEIHQKKGLLTVINVHNVAFAKKYATRLLALKNGRVVFDGVPREFQGEQFRDIYESI